MLSLEQRVDYLEHLVDFQRKEIDNLTATMLRMLNAMSLLAQAMEGEPEPAPAPKPKRATVRH